jgi:hypothetical protein
MRPSTEEAHFSKSALGAPSGAVRHRRQRGQAVVLVALLIMALIGAVGLAIDIGNAVAHQREDQSAADAAALAAADRLSNGQTEAVAASAGTNVAALAGVPSGNLTINFLDGSRVATATPNSVVWIQAKVIESVPTYFMRAMGIAASTVSALAEVKYPKKCAICFLDPSASPALDISSSGGLSVTGGCVQVNSSGSPAATLTSGGGITAPCTNVVGTVAGAGPIVPPAVTGVAPVPDPLAKLPYPQPPMSTFASVAPGGTNTVISPGVYNRWDLGGSGNLYLNPGTYVITGGIAVSSGGGIKNCPAPGPCPAGVSPGGVTLFLTCPNWPGTGAAGPICGCPTTYGADIQVSSNGGLSVTAPTSGTYQGVAIFYDRCNNGDLAITANGGVPVTGAIYAKAAPLKITANGPLTIKGLVVTATTQISANGSLTVSYDPTDPAQAVNANWLSWGNVRLVT